MKLEGILTQREWEKRVSFDLVYAWEDIFAQELGVPLVPRSRMAEALVRRLPGRQAVPTGKKHLLLTEMEPMPGKNAYNRAQVIPYWIDFFLREPSLPVLVRSYNSCPAIFVSSREAYEFLQEQGTGLPLYHLAGSAGTVYRKMEQGRFLYYDQTGACLGDVDDHDKFMDLMRRCRVGLYATPGLDDPDGRTHGFSQVTPRFLEYLSAGCHVLMRYRSNPDTDYYGLESFCPSADTYEVFENTLTDFLRRPVDMDRNREYLSGHTTSARARELRRILSNL